MKAHHKAVHHKEGGPSSLEDQSDSDQYLRTLRIYVGRHWAWPAMIVLWWLSARHRHSSDAVFTIIILTAAVVAILGWRQLTTDSYWRGYFTILLFFAGLLVFVGAFSVLFILILIGILAVAVDLFVVAPHR